MDVRLPDGTIVRNVPEGITKSQLMSRVGKLPADARQDAEQRIAAKEKPAPGFLDRLKQGMADANIGFNQRATDIQLAAQESLPEWASNALTYEIGKGVPSREELLRRRDVLKTAAQDLAAQRQGDEGIIANLQRGLGNPAAVASTLAGGPLYAAAFGAGAGTEFLASSPEGKSLSQKAQDAGIAGTMSAVTAPVVGKAIDSAMRPVQTAKNIGGMAGKLLGIEPERLATFQAANVIPTLGDVSKSTVVKRTQNVLDDVPLASNILDKGKDRVAEGVKQGLAKAGFDDSLERAVGGDAAKQGLKSYADRGRKLFSQAFDEFDTKHIAPDEMTTAGKTFAKIKDITSRADTAEALDAYLGPTEKGIIAKIKGAAEVKPTPSALLDASGQPLLRDPKLITPQPRLTYNDFKLFRTAIGKKLDDYTIGSSDKAVLRELYGAMTEDLRQKASEKGSTTLKAFDRLNNNYRLFSQKLDDTVNEVVNKGEASSVFNAVRQGLPLPERTGVIMRALPAEKRDIVRGALIREMGTARTQAGAGQFDPVRFAAEFKKLDPKAQDAFLIGLPKETKAGFQKVIDAALLAKQTALQSNPSGTARNMLIGAAGVSALSNPMLVAKVISSGALTARLMTSPKFISWLANAPKSTGTQLGRYVGLLSGVMAGDAAAEDDARQLQDALTQENAPTAPDPAQLNALSPSAGPQSNAAPLLDRIAQAESSGNPNAKAKSSTASGLFQFTDSTWAAAVQKWGKETGVTLKDKANPEAQRVMAERLTADNARILKNKLGTEPKEADLYAAHFLGASGAAKLIQALGTGKQAITLFPRAVVNDPVNRKLFFDGKTPRTVEQVYALLSNKISA